MSEELAAFADFFDGRSARSIRAGVSIEGGTLVIRQPEGETVSWTLTDLRLIPDQARSDVLVLTSARAPLARLYLGRSAMHEHIRLMAPYLRRRPPVRGRGRVAAWAMGAIAAVAAIVFVLVPVMSDQLAEILPPEGEKALGDATFEQVREALAASGLDALPLCTAPDGQAALAAMETRLTDGLRLPYPLTVSVLDHELINAFALPGGHIVFFRGLIEAAETPDEVAAVFAHELGHVVARDPARIALRTAGSIGVLGLLLGDFAGGAVVLFLAERLIQADYTQEAEAEADAFAHERLIAVGLPPAALARMFQRLQARYGEETGLLEHFLSHPALGDRIARAEAVGQGTALSGPSLSEEEWAALRAICR